jgi:hypothetical protein
VIVLLGTGGANGGGYTASKYVVLAIHGFFLILHGLINSLPIRWLSWFGKLGAFWNTAGVLYTCILPISFQHLNSIVNDPCSQLASIGLSLFNSSSLKQFMVGAFTLVILIPTVAKERASTKFIFTHFNEDNGMGIHGKAYILALGLLTSQYSLLGYDTSAHMVCIFDFFERET